MLAVRVFYACAVLAMFSGGGSIPDATADPLDQQSTYSFDDIVTLQKQGHKELAKEIIYPTEFNKPGVEIKEFSGRFWRCALKNSSDQCIQVKVVGYSKPGPGLNQTQTFTFSRESLQQTKELIEQMMMELKFRGLDNEHPLIQEAWKTGKSMNDRLLFGDE